MREIKFRAWHKTRKKYYEVLHLHVETIWNGGIWATCLGYSAIEGKDIEIQIQPKDIIIEQYTGLKDKNGVEIYDGDIVKELGLKETWVLSRYDEFSERKHIVMWEKENLEWCGNLIDDEKKYDVDTRPLTFLNRKYTLEVIGNIHEVAHV